MVKTRKFALVMGLILAITVNACALRNPAAVYCEALGYEYVVESKPGGDYGYCKFSDGSMADSWKFLVGESHPDKSYCIMQGHTLKTIQNISLCLQLASNSCAVCVLDDGVEVEVTKLMGLSFKETICGDGVCGLPENNMNCPIDCPKSGLDGYCDNEEDGVCDLDCLDDEDPDCKETPETGCLTQILPVIAFAIALIQKIRL